MADKRINALANTAPNTASDDFIAIDGTTNGTRKLNAFSPTFGGNATVTGTLTVNGTGASSFAGRLAIGASALSDRMFYVSGSTGTTGASQFSAVVNPTLPNTVTTGAYGLYLGTNIATGATITNSYSLYIASPDYTGSTITNKYGLYSNDPNPSYFVGNVLVGSTTASTTTSSGALVVSGGVGVAGDLTSGGNGKFGSWTRTSSLLCLNTFGGSSGVNLFRQNLASDPGTLSAGDRFFLYVSDATEGLRIGTDGSNSLFKLTTAGAMTLASSIQTSAPSGGTAAAWKLGTVATVSPTSPNRTIEVDIGGTIYYIHAKTTNN